MKKQSKLEKIGKKEPLSKNKLDIRYTLGSIGLVYSIFLGVPTLGAIGGLAYSLYTGDHTMLKDIGCGAAIGGGLEVIGLMLYGMTPTRTDE